MGSTARDGLVSLSLCSIPVQRFLRSCEPWLAYRPWIWMQPRAGGGNDPREEHGAVAAAQDAVSWKTARAGLHCWEQRARSCTLPQHIPAWFC